MFYVIFIKSNPLFNGQTTGRKLLFSFFYILKYSPHLLVGSGRPPRYQFAAMQVLALLLIFYMNQF